VSVSTTGIRSARRHRDERRIYTVQCGQTKNIHPSAKGSSRLLLRDRFFIFLFFFLESRRNQIFAVDAGQIFDIPVDGIRKTNGNQTRSCPRDSGCRRRFQNIRRGLYNGKRIIYIYIMRRVEYCWKRNALSFLIFQVFSMMSRDFLKKGQFLYMFNLKPSVGNVFMGLKNCNIYLCANKDELDELLKKHL